MKNIRKFRNKNYIVRKQDVYVSFFKLFLNELRDFDVVS